MSKSSTPSIPSLVQMITRLLLPCLPMILTTDGNLVTYGLTALSPPSSRPSKEHLQIGTMLWDALWPDIVQDFETLTAVRQAAYSPTTPVWHLAFE